MLWAVADTLNQDFESSLIRNEKAKPERFHLTETVEESCEM